MEPPYKEERNQRAGASLVAPGTVPPVCPTCGAVPKERSRCPQCGEPTWVYEHGDHYKWGREVLTGCKCRPGKGRPQPRVGPDGVDRGRMATPEMARKAAEGIAAGKKYAVALREAGYSESMAKAGRRSMSKMILAELKTLGRKYIEIGRQLTPEDQENMVRGRLVESTIVGTDKGVMAAKQLGADKRVAMWQPESTANLIVLQAPPVRRLDHPVPLLPSEHPEDLE